MPFQQHGREYDLVVFGATGHTGLLTAEHITTHLPTNLRWAIAGRSRAKLEKVVTELKALNPDRKTPAIEACDLNDTALSALAKRAFVFITTVGPYGAYGEHAFKACAENGTHYLDVTGEVPFVAAMIKKYEVAAKMTGAIMIPEIGIESAPSDLVTWSLAAVNRTVFGAKTRDAIVSVHDLSSAPSGGTLATVLTLFDNFSLSDVKASHAPYALSPVLPPGGAVRSPQPLLTTLTGCRTVSNLGGLVTTSLAATVDAAIVERSWGLLSSLPSRQKEAYGPNFRFRQYMKARNYLTGMAIHFGLVVASLMLLLPPVRQLAKRFVYQPGEGPSREDAAKDYVEYRGIAWPDIEEQTPGGKEEVKGRGKQAFCKAWYRGSMYYLTGILLAQAALTILEDEELGLDGGVYTPACLGQGFIDRLNGVGFKMETKVVDEY